jgi:hypothetical protein
VDENWPLAAWGTALRQSAEMLEKVGRAGGHRLELWTFPASRDALNRALKRVAQELQELMVGGHRLELWTFPACRDALTESAQGVAKEL